MRRKSSRLVWVTAWLMTGWLMTGLPGCGMYSDETAESFSSIPDTEWGEPAQEVREGNVSGSSGRESVQEAEEDKNTSASAVSKDESTSASATSEDGGMSASAASEDESTRSSAASEEAASEENLTFTLGSGLSDLPAEVQEQVNALNEGKPPGSVIDSEELEGCYALIATHTIIAADKETGEESTGKGRLTFYVPNLLEGLEGVAALFYNREAGAWEILTPDQINTEAKTVSVNLTGSGILTVIYRRE